MSLHDLVKRAWNLREDQIAGGPAWTSEENYNIIARASFKGAEPTPTQWLAMVKALLADRFGLRVHEEKRELSVYALVPKTTTSQLGGRIRRSTTDCDAFRRAIAEAQNQRVAAPPPEARCGFGVRMSGERATLDQSGDDGPMANYLTPFAGRTIIARTALDGRFDVELDVSAAVVRQMAGPARPAEAGPADEPDLFCVRFK